MISDDSDSDVKFVNLSQLSAAIGGGTVTSVGVSMPAAFSVANSPITGAGTIAITGAGSTSQYIRGDGTLETFPTIPSGSVTSVGLAAPSAFTVTNSPVTSSGTLTLAGAGSTSQFIDGTGALQTVTSGSVTSVAASASNGLTVSGSPITTSGTLAFGISAGGIQNDRLANNTISGVALGSNLNSLSASTGLTMTSYNGSAAVSDLGILYTSTNNAIEAATNLKGTAIATTDVIWYSDIDDDEIKKGLVSDLPFDSSGGTVTSIETPAAGGLTGGTITTTGSLSLKNFGGLSTNKIMKWNGTDNQLTDSLITDDGALVTIAGNLTVNGTTTTIDSTTVSIKDNMMEYANGNDVAGGGANSVDIGWFGNYVISSTDYYPAMFYDASASSSASAPKFRLGNATSKPGNTATIANVGTLLANVEGEITGNAATATKLISARSISATGDAAWSVTFDGSADVTSGLTLATVNSTVGSFGSASNTLTATVNAKGLVTAMAATAISITASQVSDFCTAVESCIGSSHQYAQDIGNNSATSYTVSHNFGTRDVIVQVYDTASPYDTLFLEVQRTSTNALTLLSTSAIATGGARCLVTKVA